MCGVQKEGSERAETKGRAGISQCFVFALREAFLISLPSLMILDTAEVIFIWISLPLNVEMLMELLKMLILSASPPQIA